MHGREDPGSPVKALFGFILTHTLQVAFCDVTLPRRWLNAYHLGEIVVIGGHACKLFYSFLKFLMLLRTQTSNCVYVWIKWTKENPMYAGHGIKYIVSHRIKKGLNAFWRNYQLKRGTLVEQWWSILQWCLWRKEDNIVIWSERSGIHYLLEYVFQAKIHVTYTSFIKSL
jgi:hypothetical protein